MNDEVIKKEYNTFSERMELMTWWDHVMWAIWVFIALVAISSGGSVFLPLWVAFMLFDSAYHRRHRNYLLEQVKELKERK